ncbi:hypothetical protein ACFWIB_41300 [Streptomyces sp. NPDC127051]|uniref:hypothetical protein n=1 Tax=Streptomyces sp. NPDC127051 TaxID=3347119 RepID=UPI0036673CFE
MTRPAFNPADLTTAPLYSLNPTAAQRSVPDWIEAHGGLFAPIHISADEVAKDCGSAASTMSLFNLGFRRSA